MGNLTLRGQYLRAAERFGQKVGMKVLHVQRAAQVRAFLEYHVAARECGGQHAQGASRSTQSPRFPSLLCLLDVAHLVLPSLFHS